MSVATHVRPVSRLLIVEDDPSQLRTITDIMLDEGFDAIGCRSAAEAVEHVRREDFGVAVVDLHLSDLSGTELLEQIRSMKCNVPVIIHTGHASFDSAKSALNLGAFAYVEKIGDPSELVGHVHRAVQEQMRYYVEDLEVAVEERTLQLQATNAQLQSEIEERKAAEQALRKSEQSLRRAQQNAHVGSFELTPEGSPSYWSDECFRILGLDPNSELLSRSQFLEQIVHPDDRGYSRRLIQKTLEECTPFNYEYRVLRPDGSIRWLHSRGEPICDVTGKLVAVEGTVLDITDRKHTADSLIGMNVALSNAMPGISRLDTAGLYVEVNDYYAHMLGYEPDDLFGNDWSPTVHSEDQPVAIQAYDLMCREGKGEFEARAVRKDGSLFHKHVLMVRIDDLDGVMTGHHCFMRDITERKQAEEDLQKSETRFRKYFELGLVGLSITSPEKGWIEVNDRLCEICGYTRSELMRKTWPELTHPDDLAEDFEQFQRVLAGDIDGYAIEKRITQQDGTLIHVSVHINCLRKDDGSVDYFVAMVQDITDRILAEQATREKQIQLDGLLANVDAIILEGYPFDFHYVGGQVEKILGYPKEMWIDHPEGPGGFWFELLHPDDVDKPKYCRQMIERGEDHSFEYRLIAKDGTPIWFYDSVMVEARDGKPVKSRAVMIDITDRKQAEDDQKQLMSELEAQSAEMERFAYTVSHDLKSPLITIQGFLGLLKKDISDGSTEKIQKNLKVINEAADKMQSLLGDVLKLSQIGRVVGIKKNVSVAELARDAIDLVAGQIAKSGVEIEISNELPVIFGDRRRLLEVLQNLVENAVKFMGDQPQPRVEIGMRHDGETTVCYVRDNGIGLDTQQHERVFGLFNRLNSKVEGTGIGLALVQRIVEVHGGRIWIESEGLGTGCTFCFTIPESTESENHVE